MNEILKIKLLNTVNNCKHKPNELPESGQEISSAQAKAFFLGWLNNKMMILLIWIQQPGPKSVQSIQRQIYFLDDLYRHFMSRERQNGCAGVVKWLKSYLRCYPYVSKTSRLIAIQMCKRIYRTYGLMPEFKIEGDNHGNTDRNT